jgi:hypothetical protein
MAGLERLGLRRGFPGGGCLQRPVLAPDPGPKLLREQGRERDEEGQERGGDVVDHERRSYPVRMIPRMNLVAATVLLFLGALGTGWIVWLRREHDRAIGALAAQVAAMASEVSTFRAEAAMARTELGTVRLQVASLRISTDAARAELQEYVPTTRDTVEAMPPNTWSFPPRW